MYLFIYPTLELSRDILLQPRGSYATRRYVTTRIMSRSGSVTLLTFRVAGAVFGIDDEMRRLPAYFGNPVKFSLHLSN